MQRPQSRNEVDASKEKQKSSWLSIKEWQEGGPRRRGDRGRGCRALWATVRTLALTLPETRSRWRVLRRGGT